MRWLFVAGRTLRWWGSVGQIECPASSSISWIKWGKPMQSRTRLVILFIFMIAIGGLVVWRFWSPPWQWRSSQKEETGSGACRYLVVYVAGPNEWMKEHKFTTRWQGKEVPLPVIFRVKGTIEKFEMGSPGEIFGQLEIGDVTVPVTADPDTKFQVRNTGAVSFIQEKSNRKGAVGLSIASSVAISPPDFPGEVSPTAGNGELETAGINLEKRLKDLIAQGQVVDVATK